MEVFLVWVLNDIVYYDGVDVDLECYVLNFVFLVDGVVWVMVLWIYGGVWVVGGRVDEMGLV